MKLGTILSWHRSAALVLAVMVFFYSLSGWFYVDAFENLGSPTAEHESAQPLAAAPAALDDPWAAGSRVARELGIRGRLEDATTSDDHVLLSFRRPGVEVQVKIERDAEVAHITRRELGGAATARALHGQRHARGGLAFVVWALLADLTALALLFFAVTGVILSWREDRARALRWGLPAAAFTLWMVGYLRFLP